MPDTLTRWRFTAVGADDRTRVGEATADVLTRKNLIARMIAPRFLVEKDRAYLTGIVHNYLSEEKDCVVRLEVSPNLDLAPSDDPRAPSSGRVEREVSVRIPAGDEARVDLLCGAMEQGEATLTLTPRSLASARSARERPTTACFDAV